MGCFLLAGASAVAAPPAAGLRQALIFHAPFDRDADAGFARGDPRIHTAADRTLNARDAARPGLHADGLVRVAPGEGKFGGALEFKQKTTQLIFFRGGENLGYKPKNWNGALSFWLRLDPDKDLEPGYCDPVQLVAQAWNEGNLFVEFSKDHTPRHFRFAIMAVAKSALTLGVAYAGFIDDLAVFDRELTDAEAAYVCALGGGIAGLREN